MSSHTDSGANRALALRVEPLRVSPLRASITARVFEDLIADFVIEEGREPDLQEMAYFARRVQRYNFAETL